MISGLEEVRYIKEPIIDLYVCTSTSSPSESFDKGLSASIETNDVTRLQALVDRKKVVITEAAIRDVLRLDDAEGVDCLPNEEIFAELASMGYEKPSTKLTFYKAFFSSEWKLQSMSAKRTSWNEFSSVMTSAVICMSTGRRFNFSKYIFESLVRNVDNTSKFYMYPRFLQLLIRNQLGDVEEQVQDDVDDAAAQGADNAVQRDAAQEARDALTALTIRVEHLKYDKVAQALEITKLKRRVKKLEKGNRVKVLKLRRLQKEDDPAEVHKVVDVVTTAKLITEVVTAASETVATASITISVAEPQVPSAAITTAAPVRVAAASTRRRKRVVIMDPEEESTIIIHADTKSKDKGKGIMVEESKPIKKNQQVKMDEEYARKLHEELNKDIDWDVAIEHGRMIDDIDKDEGIELLKDADIAESEGRHVAAEQAKNRQRYIIWIWIIPLKS
nr:hypothetical protein [Tanacetum cinerariifolium]